MIFRMQQELGILPVNPDAPAEEDQDFSPATPVPSTPVVTDATGTALTSDTFVTVNRTQNPTIIRVSRWNDGDVTLGIYAHGEWINAVVRSGLEQGELIDALLGHGDSGDGSGEDRQDTGPTVEQAGLFDSETLEWLEQAGLLPPGNDLPNS